MPKKLKLNLGDLKIQSFVTSLDDSDAKGVKGGATELGFTCNFKCGETEYWECETEPCGTGDQYCTDGAICGWTVQMTCTIYGAPLNCQLTG